MSLQALAAPLYAQSDPEERAGPAVVATSAVLNRSRKAPRSKDVVELAEDELHRLVLVNHVHRHVAVVPLWAHQRRPEHDADVLGGHSVDI